MTTEFQTPESPKFLLTDGELADAFMNLVQQSDPYLLRTVYSNTITLFLAKTEGDAEALTPEQFEDVLVDAANDAYDLIVQELQAIRDAKIDFARGGFPAALL